MIGILVGHKKKSLKKPYFFTHLSSIGPLHILIIAAYNDQSESHTHLILLLLLLLLFSYEKVICGNPLEFLVVSRLTPIF